MIDIRRLFDRHHIRWRDRGKNVSHNNLVISCIYCNKTSNKDPGEHLSINYVTGECYCYRNSGHKGFVAKILYDLKIPQSEFKDLTFKFTSREEPKDEREYSLFHYFQPANEQQEALDYLQSRLFARPLDICKKFNLRVDSQGRWAGRIIIPLTKGWTGRSMREHIEPRYLAFTSKDGFFLYKQNSTSCILVEGAMDAMRIASVSNQFDVIAKCRNGISPAIITFLREGKYMSILNAPDGDVDFSLYFQEQKLLTSYCTYASIKLIKLPENVKDFGEMTEHQTREFLIRRAYA